VSRFATSGSAALRATARPCRCRGRPTMPLSGVRPCRGWCSVPGTPVSGGGILCLGLPRPHLIGTCAGSEAQLSEHALSLREAVG